MFVYFFVKSAELGLLRGEGKDSPSAGCRASTDLSPRPAGRNRAAAGDLEERIPGLAAGRVLTHGDHVGPLAA